MSLSPPPPTPDQDAVQSAPNPSSTISVVGRTVGFQFHGVDGLPFLPDSASSRLSLIRRKHLSHLYALEDDGFDFLPPDAQDCLAGSRQRPPSPPQLPMNWKARLLASANASTLRIAGVGRKLKNKAILLRDVILPQSLNQPPPPVYHTQAAPTPFSHLPPPVKHEFVSQRIICVRDIVQQTDEKADAFESEALSDRSLVSPAWNPTRKHLSTLPEEGEDFFNDDEDDDGSRTPQPDVFLEAVLMPVENLQNIQDLSKTLGANLSQVSPPWMSKPLGDSNTTLKAHQSPVPPARRPATGSTFDSNTGSSYGEIIHSPTLRFDVDANSVFRLSRSTADGAPPPRDSQYNSDQLHPQHALNRPVSIMSFLSVTDSSYGTGARRRSSSLVMMPTSGRGSRNTMGRDRGSTWSGGRDKENEVGGYASHTFGKGSRKPPVEYEPEEEDEDEEDEQEYYVFEANPDDAKIGPDGQRESVLILLPVPSDHSDAPEIPDEEDEEGEARDDFDVDHRFLSRWSATVNSDDPKYDETISNPFLTPMPGGGKPLPSIPAASRTSFGSFTTAPNIPTPVQTPPPVKPPTTQQSYFNGPKHILPIKELDRKLPLSSTISLPTTLEKKKDVSRARSHSIGQAAPPATTPLNWSKDGPPAVPLPVPSPSLPVVELAPPKVKQPSVTHKSSGSGSDDRERVAEKEQNEEKEPLIVRRNSDASTSSKKKPGSKNFGVDELGRRVSGGVGMLRARSLSTSTFGKGDNGSIKSGSPKVRPTSKLSTTVIGPPSPLRSKSIGNSSSSSKKYPATKRIPPAPAAPVPPPPASIQNRRVSETKSSHTPPRTASPVRPLPPNPPLDRSGSTSSHRPRTPKTPASAKSKHSKLPSVEVIPLRGSDSPTSVQSFSAQKELKERKRQTAEFLKSTGKAFQGHSVTIEVVDQGSGETEVYMGSGRSKKLPPEWQTSPSTRLRPSL